MCLCNILSSILKSMKCVQQCFFKIACLRQKSLCVCRKKNNLQILYIIINTCSMSTAITQNTQELILHHRPNRDSAPPPQQRTYIKASSCKKSLSRGQIQRLRFHNVTHMVIITLRHHSDMILICAVLHWYHNTVYINGINRNGKTGSPVHVNERTRKEGNYSYLIGS